MPDIPANLPGSLDEIRALFAHLPGPDLESGTAAALCERQLTKPAGALGRLEELSSWLATWQGRHPPRIDHPRTCVFAGNHGVAARGVSAYPAAVTAQMVQNFVTGGAAVNQLCKVVDADLRVYEMNLEQPTADFVDGPAMSEEDCARALAYGMMAVEPGIDVLALGEMGIANTTSAAALCLALFGGSAEDWTGPGTGVAGAAFDRKRKVVAAAVARHREAVGNPLELLRRLGGNELAAIAGAVLAARMGRVPVLLDGFTATAAAAVLYALDPRALDHCVVAHVSAEPGHLRLLDKIGKRALFDFGMRLGEASGATLAIAILKAAIACHNGMATFAGAGVSGPA
ncbi:MAG TPA: nicotinate-nucleotide--dimethylbenzimidazole phosphoribosyltransferase [Stellaceae bacterium]|jgi:nicotinate-nucleotide--dimethylbenzimidazole phosphoribosyltransferase|nr:nicotinate-nucleotide--dimethylbenzimidazole phosphoribosyltransferase [Stellaceae bacterium]